MRQYRLHDSRVARVARGCELHNGDTVVVFGDDVPEARARVLSGERAGLEFESLDA